MIEDLSEKYLRKMREKETSGRKRVNVGMGSIVVRG